VNPSSIPVSLLTANSSPILNSVRRHGHSTATWPFYNDAAIYGDMPILQRHGHSTVTWPFDNDMATTTWPFYGDMPILQQHGHSMTTRVTWPFDNDMATTTWPFYGDMAILQQHSHYTTTCPFYNDVANSRFILNPLSILNYMVVLSYFYSSRRSAASSFCPCSLARLFSSSD
jgi:hypothetical protein